MKEIFGKQRYLLDLIEQIVFKASPRRHPRLSHTAQNEDPTECK